MARSQLFGALESAIVDAFVEISFEGREAPSAFVLRANNTGRQGYLSCYVFDSILGLHSDYAEFYRDFKNGVEFEPSDIPCHRERR